MIKNCSCCNNKFDAKRNEKYCSEKCKKIKKKTIKICLCCGKQFWGNINSKYCCRKCTDKSYSTLNKKIICKQCGKEFVAHCGTKFCCEKCKIESRKTLRVCPECGKEFFHHKRRFCTKSCAGKNQMKKQCENGWISPNKGKTKENNETIRKAAEKISKKLIGRKIPKHIIDKTSKSLKEFWKKNKNSPHILERNKKISEKRMGHEVTNTTRKKISDKLMGHIESIETRKKKRLIAINRILKNHGCFCNYNPSACEWFKKFDEMNNVKGRYAMYGGGEYLIPELWLFTDYINFDLKLIMEWDEERHYKNGNLLQEDIERQKEIQEYFSDFHFIRIRERDINEKTLEKISNIINLILV